MKSRLVKGVKVQRGSGNVYADLGLPDAEKLKIKTGLVIAIRKAMLGLGLTQQEAARRMGITQPKVSDMMRGDFSNLSERKLMDCLTRLGFDVEIEESVLREQREHMVEERHARINRGNPGAVHAEREHDIGLGGFTSDGGEAI